MSPTAASLDKTTIEANSDSVGLIISHFGAALAVESIDGELYRCSARKRLGALVCGDRVLWQPTQDQDGVITELLPRSSLLSRPDARGRLKPVAANVSQLLVVVAPRNGGPAQLFDELVDRYLVAAELSEVHPAIVINKTDLVSKDERTRIDAAAEAYRRIGYPVLLTSTKARHGLDDLVAQLREQTSVFVGQSGVGKSSLVQALLPELEIRIAAVSEATGLGRHTTTTTTLYHLPQGGDLVDSPGVREFGLWHVSAAELARGFIEFSRYSTACKFNNCLHRGEPECAVEEAARRHEIDMARLRSYRNILKETIT